MSTHFNSRDCLLELRIKELEFAFDLLISENRMLKGRIKRLESSIIRAANQCFCDASDGRTAAEMLKILEAANEAKP